MKKISYLMLSIVILIVIFILLPSILNLIAKDIDPIDDSDLSLQIISIPDKDNAYFDLIKIKDVIYEPEKRSKDIIDMIDQKMWDEKLAKEIVSRNQEAFEYFSRASHKPKYQNPVFTDPKNINPNIVFTFSTSWRRMAQFSSIRASYLSKQGKDKEAIHEALNSVYIGQKMQGSQVSLLGYLVAISMKETGLETVQRVIASSNLGTEELKKYAKDMNQFYKNEDGFTTSFKGGYYMQSLIVDALVRGDTEILQSYTEEQSQDIAQILKNNYYFKPNRTKAIFAEYARKNIENANKFCNGIQNIDIQMLAPSSFLELYLTENAIGKILHDVTATSLSSVNTKKCDEDSLVSVTQALIAIKAYKSDYGQYPISLDELVPDYLSSVPLDYFDGNSLRYSMKNKILYSIGRDLKDNGGSTGEDWHKMPDPTFKINF